MTARELYTQETGVQEPDNQIAYHQWFTEYVHWLEKKVINHDVKKFRLSNVNEQSEILLTFAEWYNNNEIIKPRSLILKDDVLIFLNQK